MTLNPDMVDVQFRAGRFYSLEELAELARRSLETQGLTQTKAAAILNERYEGQRGRFYQTQVSAALKDPTRNPAMVLLLVEAFTDYKTDQQPRYLLERRK